MCSIFTRAPRYVSGVIIQRDWNKMRSGLLVTATLFLVTVTGIVKADVYSESEIDRQATQAKCDEINPCYLCEPYVCQKCKPGFIRRADKCFPGFSNGAMTWESVWMWIKNTQIASEWTRNAYFLGQSQPEIEETELQEVQPKDKKSDAVAVSPECLDAIGIC
ncbi:hypothetical protein B566_EDAN010705 [Ephemera danica]|nr:hypothetical protein B566_EDAN010705 [Ephemera danica]